MRYPFEFETVQVDERGQTIERKRGRAFAFREPLSSHLSAAGRADSLLENVNSKGRISVMKIKPIT